jgi:glycerol-3-phosphate cytidylyltransferase
MSRDWVYVGGTFDMFHYGHMSFLRECQKYGPVLVSLNTDEFAERYKRKPIMTIGERMEALNGCKYVDDVCINVGDENSGKTIDLISDRQIAYIAHGDDWFGPDLLNQLGVDDQWLSDRAIKMLYVPYTKGISTSDIIGRINGDTNSDCNCSCGQG